MNLKKVEPSDHFPLEPTIPLPDKGANALFLLASYLTDPICNAHQLFRRIQIANASSPSDLTRKVSLSVGLVSWAALAILTTLPAILLRSLGCYLQTKPYTHIKGEGEPLKAASTFSLLSWNVCCVGAGYSISDGGVIPWPFRIDGLIEEILKQNAEVVCLYEVFDYQCALRMCNALKTQGYVDFYFHIGPRAIGVSSGIFVASKYQISAPEFLPFPLETLVGRTKNSSKGCFSFDLKSEREAFARIFATHLQHSEEPELAEEQAAYQSASSKTKERIDLEKDCRAQQMSLILEKAKNSKDKAVILTGDLNLGDNEYSASPWASSLDKGALLFTEKTWGGDAFCSGLVGGKHTSGAINLDHTAAWKESVASLSTSLVKTGFDASRFEAEALSDHAGLYSTVNLHQKRSSPLSTLLKEASSQELQ